MRADRVIAVICAFGVWLMSICGGFVAVAFAASFLYQLCYVCYRMVKQSPTFPVDKFRFASMAASATALLMIGVFATHRSVRSHYIRVIIWIGLLIGVLLYLAFATWRLVAG